MPKKPQPPIPDACQAEVEPDVLDLIELASAPFEAIISDLEAVIPGRGWMPGTTLTRILLDNKVAQSYGLEPADTDREASPAWCLALGKPGEPKTMFYGWSLRDAVQSAVLKVLK